MSVSMSYLQIGFRSNICANFTCGQGLRARVRKMGNSVAILQGLKQSLFGPRFSSDTVTTLSEAVSRFA